MERQEQEYLMSEIQGFIDEFATTHLPSGFIWRPYQKETIYSSLCNIIFDHKSMNVDEEITPSSIRSVLSECPTGSGKSIMAMCIAYVLLKYGIDSYILTSDISLQNQYEEDFRKFNIKWGSLKGIDRYNCYHSDHPCSVGDCVLSGSRPSSKRYRQRCGDVCPYLIARTRSENSSITLMNYAVWMSYMKVLTNGPGEPPFSRRSVVICDEAHNISNIVQSQFSPVINSSILYNLNTLYEFISTLMQSAELDHIMTVLNILQDIIDRGSSLTNIEMFELLKLVVVKLKEVENLCAAVNNLIRELGQAIAGDKHIMKGMKAINNVHTFITSIFTYTDIISNTSSDGIIINATEKSVTLNLLYDKYLMDKYFNPYFSHALYMSATIGDASEFFIDNSLRQGVFYQMPSSFNFERSPIYVMNSRYMSYKQMDANIPWMVEQIEKILNMHPNEKGIIHSASYKLTKEIESRIDRKLKRRLLVYTGSNEKQEKLDEMVEVNSNSVLIGPSLIEGVNLPDDQCRFIIFAKVPYLSLADKYVNAKKDENNKWYSNKTIVNILQGVGRGVRSETDWCQTYVLDANFCNLYGNNISSFPYDFRNRLKFIKEI